MSALKLFQGLQALLVAILLLGGIWFVSSAYAYGWAMIGMGTLLFLYDRRGFFLMVIANAAYRGKGLDAALVWFERAWRWKALDANAEVTYAFLLMKAGRFDRAVEAFKAMKTRGPWLVGGKHQPLMHSYEAMLFWKQGQRQLAVDLLAKLKQEGYVTRSLLTNLGGWLLELKQLDVARVVCREGLDYDAEDPGLLDNWAWCLWLSGEAEEAREIFLDKLIPSDPPFADAWIHWARILRANGEKDAAVSAYSMALRKPFHGLSLYERQQVEKEARELGG